MTTFVIMEASRASSQPEVIVGCCRTPVGVDGNAGAGESNHHGFCARGAWVSAGTRARPGSLWVCVPCAGPGQGRSRAWIRWARAPERVL